MGGIRYVMGTPDGPPVRAGISLGDSLAATFACLGTLVALHHRERSGQGQVVDSAIYEAVLAMMESLLPEWAVAGYQRERTGAVLPNVAPSNVYPTGDGDLVLIAANQDTVFGRLAQAMGCPELATNPRFASHSARGAAMTELDDLIARWTATRTAASRRGGSSGRRSCSTIRTSLPGRRSSPSRTLSSAYCPCRTWCPSFPPAPVPSGRPARLWASTTTRYGANWSGSAPRN
jgi:hypothetical protein